MKYLIIATLLFCLTPQTDFCNGWEEGYCEGWKDVKGQLAICPITPLCPIPPIDCESYNCGYNRGFKAGRKKANDEINQN